VGDAVPDGAGVAEGGADAVGATEGSAVADGACDSVGRPVVGACVGARVGQSQRLEDPPKMKLRPPLKPVVAYDGVARAISPRQKRDAARTSRKQSSQGTP